MSKFQQEFEVLEELGRGGFGVVFKVFHRILDQHYAVKCVLLPQDTDMSSFVFREVRTLARLEHPNVVRFFACWVENGVPECIRPANAGRRRKSLNQEGGESYVFFEEEDSGMSVDSDDDFSATVEQNSDGPMATWLTLQKHAASTYNCPTTSIWKVLFIQMELADTTMATLLAQDPLDVKTRLMLFCQLLKGVEFLHSLQIVHNDLKPSNLFIMHNELKIGDFGLVSVHSLLGLNNGGPASSLCNAGTPLYSSPELQRTTQSDIFSLGIVLVEFLIGFDKRYEVLSTIRMAQFKWESYPVLMPFRTMIEKMLKRDPKERPTASETRQLLRQVLKHEGLVSGCLRIEANIPHEDDNPSPMRAEDALFEEALGEMEAELTRVSAQAKIAEAKFCSERRVNEGLENKVRELQKKTQEKTNRIKETDQRVLELEAELTKIKQQEILLRSDSFKTRTDSSHNFELMNSPLLATPGFVQQCDSAVLNQILEFVPEAAAVIDVVGRIKAINSDAATLFGYADAEVLHHFIGDILPPSLQSEKTREFFMQVFEKMNPPQARSRFAVCLRKKNGDTQSAIGTLKVHPGGLYVVIFSPSE